MATKSKILRKGYSILSIVLALSVLLCMFAMPMTVSAETAAPNIIVAQDSFDTLSGWEYTDGVASVTEGKLQLATGVDSANGTDGYIANVITRPEVSTEQSVTVEVSCDDIAAGKYPAIWLRVQDDGTNQKGYALLGTVSGSQFSLGLWWIDTSSATSRAYITNHRTIGTSYFSGTAAGDTMVITFSAVGTNPTVLTMTSDFVNIDWKEETSYEDSTAAFQTSGKVGLSAKSSSTENTMGFDNFVYKSNTVDAVVTDDFSDNDVSLSEEQLEFAISGTNPTTSFATRYECNEGKTAVNQSVSIDVTAEQLDAGNQPILWLRLQNSTDENPLGYYMTWYPTAGNVSIGKAYVDEEGATIYKALLTEANFRKTASRNTFTLTFTVTGDGTTTELTAYVNQWDSTGATSSWSRTGTVTDTTAELQSAGSAAISGIETVADGESTLAVTNFKYSTDDDGLGEWITLPDESYFTKADGKMSIVAPRDFLNNRKLQRPMSESATEQTASITTVASHYSAMARTVLWLRVQNADADSAPVGYYCYFVGNVMYVGKATSDGTYADLSTRTCTISDYTIYDSITYNFSATSNGDGSTALYFQLVGNKNNGTANLVMDVSATDSTAELQNAGTVAITSQQTKWNTTEQTIYFDDFSYAYPKITDEIESVIDVRSLVRIKNYIAGTLGTIGAYADYNEDGLINAEDLVTLIKHLLGSQLIGGELVTTELLTGGASAASAALKTSILSAKDTITATGTTYYVSNDGDDGNIGTSADTPLKTVEAVNTLSLSSGDAVLFNRGDVFRTTEKITVTSGVSYGAYGDGDKPVISGSLKDYADQSLWTSEDGNVWQTAVDATLVGNIVFNNGKAFGQFKADLSDVTHNGDYYFDATNKILYLFLKKNNPGKYFKSIEIATTETLLYSKGMKTDVTIENLCLKNAAKFAISTVNVSDFTITGCEIGFIGGGYSEDNMAYLGNGIEFYDTATNCVVENNYIYQIYDAAVTIQGKGTYGGFNGITFNRNLIENCSMNFEFWISDATTTNTTAVMKNINFTNNIMRFGGCGFGSFVRPTKESFGFLLARDTEYLDGQVENFNVTGNIFDCTRDSFIYATNIMSMMNIDGNTYYQTAGSTSQVIRGTGLYATNANELYTAVTTTDKNPVAVAWVNADGTIENATVTLTDEDSANDPWN